MKDGTVRDEAAPPGIDLYQLAARALASYRRHPEWDDILQEGVIRAWDYLERRRDVAPGPLLVYWGARDGAYQYLRSRRALRPQRPSHCVPAPLFVPLEECGDPPAPDERSAIETAIATAQFWRAAEARLSPRHFFILREVVQKGRTGLAVGQELGVGKAAISKILKAARKKMAGFFDLPAS